MSTITPDTTNTLFQLAIELVNQSSRNIFLTGKAGTGKTTFLKYIRESCPKQLAVVAPTGVAAINAGGVTIHSFFQLPLSPFIPEARKFSTNNEGAVNPHNLISRLRMTKEKIKVLQQLELLIIDEISMVRCDIPDAIDTVLRHVRRRPYEKFGGVQVLFIGDMFQLPPVVKDLEWKELSEFYDSPYFFSSWVIRNELPVNIEFNKIYRQSEERFIHVLNQVRNNEMDEEGMKILESRYQPGFRRNEGDGYINLTTHNETARNTNTRELSRLNNPAFNYKAEIEKDFPANSYPADEVLQLKLGAQVMFIKNDMDKSKRYFNGKIGSVIELDKDKIVVQCKGEAGKIEVNKEKWENIRYTLNKTTRQMEEEVLGSFIQYPLRLAWAITIHKSQGLTFEKAIIDAGGAFAPGQIYVALSRCTSLEGMILQSRIKVSNFFSDKRIVEFSKRCASSDELEHELNAGRKHYQEKLLLVTFDFSAAVDHGKEIHEYVADNSGSFNPETISWAEQFLNRINKLQGTAIKFHTWLQVQFQLPCSAEENTALLERTGKAAEHFIKELDGCIAFLYESPAVTDSRIHAKEYNDNLNEIFAELSEKKFLLQGWDGNLAPGAWHKRKKEFVLPSFNRNAYAGAAIQKTENSLHPQLSQQLRKLRDTICSQRNLPIYIVAGSKTIDEMARFLPQTLVELRKISGFGDAKIEQYGQQFLDVIVEYSREHKLSSLIEEKSPKQERKKSTGDKKPKTDTKAESFRLYGEGMKIDDVAKARNLTIQTIEGHLAYYVSKGEIDIKELVSPEKMVLIEPVIKDFKEGSLAPIKQRLGIAVSFGEIKLVQAWLEYQNGLAKKE